MRIAVRSILLGSLLALIPAAPATAQTATDPAPKLVKEVAALRKTLEEAVALLDRALAHQRTELLLKRLDLKERRVVPLESELRSARDALDASGNEVEQFEQMLDEAEQQISEEIRDGADRENSESRVLKQNLEQALAHVRRNLESDEDRVRRLEDELAERLEEIEILEDSLQERLENLE
jgi:flagellar biosynthesis chaperone FliJ